MVFKIYTAAERKAYGKTHGVHYTAAQKKAYAQSLHPTTVGIYTHTTTTPTITTVRIGAGTTAQRKAALEAELTRQFEMSYSTKAAIRAMIAAGNIAGAEAKFNLWEESR
jgi:hypothetical protein